MTYLCVGVLELPLFSRESLSEFRSELRPYVYPVIAIDFTGI